jgi:hypothetical protein
MPDQSMTMTGGMTVDNFPAQSDSKMYIMKGLRKQTESDVVTLQNRINRLKVSGGRAAVPLTPLARVGLGARRLLVSRA